MEHLPLIAPTLSDCERFAESEGVELVWIDVEKRDCSQTMVNWEVALIGTVADGRRFGVMFVVTMEQWWRAVSSMRAAAAQRRKAWHDWTN